MGINEDRREQWENIGKLGMREPRDTKEVLTSTFDRGSNAQYAYALQKLSIKQLDKRRDEAIKIAESQILALIEEAKIEGYDKGYKFACEQYASKIEQARQEMANLIIGEIAGNLEDCHCDYTHLLCLQDVYWQKFKVVIRGVK